MIAFEMFTNQIPFENFSPFKLIQKISMGIRPEFKCSLPDSYVNLIESCWSQDPSSRPTFDQIVIDLKTDEGFITETIDEIEFLNFVDYIDDYDVSFNSDSSVSSLDELLENDLNLDFYEKVRSFNTQRSKKVTGIDCNTTEDELFHFFSHFGEVTKIFFVRPEKGLCLIEFKYETIKNPFNFNGRRLYISPMPPNDTLLLKRLPKRTTENDIRNAFAGFNITYLKLFLYRKKQLRAHVRFESEKILEEVSKKHFVNINGAELPLLISVTKRIRKKNNKSKRKMKNLL